MSDKKIFIASNEFRVRPGAEGVYNEIENRWVYLTPGERTALREYFRDERDRELGRWRWPKNPEFAVYPTDKGCRVTNDLVGLSVDVVRNSKGTSLYDRAALAYFAAHPEKKPWHDAKPGEVWVVDFEAGVTEAVVVPPSGWVKGLAVVTARRIWPESKES